MKFNIAVLLIALGAIAYASPTPDSDAADVTDVQAIGDAAACTVGE